MQKTTDHWASRAPIFHHYLHGLTQSSSRTPGLLIAALMLAVFTPWQTVTAQTFDWCTDCTSPYTGNCNIPAVEVNPDLVAACASLDIIFILDESGSIAGFEDDVEDGVMAFLNALNGTGANVAVVEFSELGDVVAGYSTVNTAFVNSMQGYFDGTPFNGETYFPSSGTNWQDAMVTALSLAPADMILFFTDGNPTGWTNGGAVDYCGNGSTTQRPEIANPMMVSNYVKDTENTHMFMLGVGAVATANLQLMSGTDAWTSGESIASTDYVLESSFANLAEGLRQFALQLCGTTVSVTKTPSPNPICAGGTTTYTLTVTNTGTANAAINLVLRDTFPATLTGVSCASNCTNVCMGGACSPAVASNVLVWTIGDLATGASTSITVNATANSAGSIINRAVVRGNNIANTMGTSTLTVNADPTVSVTPNDLTICIGGTTTFTASVTGGAGASTYQWQFNNSGTWTNVGTNSNVYTTPTLNTAGTFTYRVLVTQASGCFGQSSNQVVVVSNDPQVSLSTPNPTICVGGTSTITATVTGGTGTNVYQWQFNNSGTWTNVGTNSNVYTTPVLNTAGSYAYRVLVTQSAGCFVQSADQIITVLNDATVSIAPTTSNVCIGGTTLLTATITGGSGSLTIRWQSSPDGSNGWVDIGGATSTTYSPPNSSAGTTFYRAIITDTSPDCSDPVSNNAQVIVSNDLSISTQPTSITECVDGTATMTVTINGGSGTISYLWQQSPNGTGSWTNATGAGATTATYTPVSTTPGTTYYRVLVNAANSGCDQVVSNNATATILADLTVTTQPTSITECVGGTQQMTVAVTGGAGTISYQWQQSPDGTGLWTNATGTGATTPNYTPVSTVAGTTFYRVLINATGNGCGQAISNNATATIVADPTITTQPTNITECVGGTGTMTVAISGGEGTISYQWQQSPTGTGSWTNAGGAGATTSTYTPDSSTPGTTHYRVLVNASGNGCGQAVSNNATAIIIADIVVTTQPTNLTECIGGTGTITVAISGGAGTISYQWQQSPDGTGSWANASGTGSTTSTYTPPSNVIGTMYYRVLINAANSGCDQAISNNATVIITPDLSITLQPIGFEECVGGIMTLEVSVTGGTGTITYQWQQSPTGSGSWANATGSGATASIFTPPSDVAGTTYYRAIISATGSGCDNVISSTATVVITPDLVFNAHPNNVIECVGGASVMAVEVSGGMGIITFQWQQSVDGISGWSDITGATASTYTPPSTTPGLTYYRVIINSN